MKKYFTKEYIKECDCKEIQGLKKFEIGDWFSIDGKIELLFANNLQYVPTEAKVLWLPTGDQLDEEIVKICKKKKYTYFVAYSYGSEYQCDATVSNPMVFNSDKEYSISCELKVNPLIAKIKLLKQLIK